VVFKGAREPGGKYRGPTSWGRDSEGNQEKNKLGFGGPRGYRFQGKSRGGCFHQRGAGFWALIGFIRIGGGGLGTIVTPPPPPISLCVKNPQLGLLVGGVKTGGAAGARRDLCFLIDKGKTRGHRKISGNSALGNMPFRPKGKGGMLCHDGFFLCQIFCGRAWANTLKRVRGWSFDICEGKG